MYVEVTTLYFQVLEEVITADRVPENCQINLSDFLIKIIRFDCLCSTFHCLV